MKYLFKLLVLMMYLAGVAQAATEGRIIVDDDITTHPPDALNEELEILESVGTGIEILLAVCQDQADCAFAISEEEMEKLIETLDKRISQINSLREQGEAEPGYLELLDDYQQTREQYALYQREIRDITQAIEEGTFFVDDTLPYLEPEPEPDVWEPRYRHEDLSLDMFEDIYEPLPFD